MNWTETRARLIELGIAADRVPVEWKLGIDLHEANLHEADLYEADLSWADLRDIVMNWQSHDLIAEILRQAAGDDWEKRRVAGLILVSRDWCWKDFLRLRHPLQGWAMDVLRQWQHCPEEEWTE